MGRVKLKDKKIETREVVEIFEIKERLKEALGAGVTIKGSCAYAHISEKEFEDLIRMDEELAEIKERAEDELGAQAMINIANKIKRGDASTTKWYLERTKSDKFGKDINIKIPVSEKEEEWEKALENIDA